MKNETKLLYKNMTFQEMLLNPPGKHSSYLGNRQVIKGNLELRFAMLLKRHKVFPIKAYQNKELTRILIHVKVPSENESYKKLYYDVFYEFSVRKDNARQLSLNAYNIKIYSNSPAFTYTYAYVANMNNIIPASLMNKVDEKSIKQKPNLKNPNLVMGFEKSLYFAALYIKHLKFHLLNVLSNKSSYFQSDDVMFGKVSTSVEKEEEYNKALIRAKREKKKAKMLKLKKEHKALGKKVKKEITGTRKTKKSIKARPVKKRKPVKSVKRVKASK